MNGSQPDCKGAQTCDDKFTISNDNQHLTCQSVCYASESIPALGLLCKTAARTSPSQEYISLNTNDSQAKGIPSITDLTPSGPSFSPASRDQLINVLGIGREIQGPSSVYLPPPKQPPRF